jgi:large subunit ribosomal protein L20
MSRVKRGVVTKHRHKRLLKQTKGYWGQRSNIFKRAAETLRRALAFAYTSRKLRKRDYRKLFITRINAAVRPYGFSYSVFINKMKKGNVVINRKMLSQIAVHDKLGFESIIAHARTV